MSRPVPVPDEISKPFWDAVNERRLVLQRCSVCEQLQYPPGAECRRCRASNEFHWDEVAGTGHILEAMTVHDTRLAPLQPDLPHTLAVVALDADPTINFLAMLPEDEVGQAQHGDPAEVIFLEVAPGRLVHDWRVAPHWLRDTG